METERDEKENQAQDALTELPEQQITMNTNETETILETQDNTELDSADKGTAESSVMDEDDDEEDEDDRDQHNTVSSEIANQYRRMIQNLSSEQLTLAFSENMEADMTSLLLPELLLYTAPDPNCIGNDAYFDEAEYNHITPFKLSTQKIKFRKNKSSSNKRQYDGEYKYTASDDELEQAQDPEREEQEGLQPYHDSLFQMDCELALYRLDYIITHFVCLCI